MVLSEISWTSAKGHLSGYLGFEVNETEQARLLRSAYTKLASLRRELRLEGVYWFSWLSQDHGDWSFWYAGLRSIDKGTIRNKPSYNAFRSVALKLEARPG
jgi:alpha-amylase/alpha-mannosidase (GH57 family)